MDQNIIFICECHSYDHQCIFFYDKENKELYLTIHLISHESFLHRVWTALKYIFGFRSRFGAWDEFIFKQEDEEKLLKYLRSNIRI